MTTIIFFLQNFVGEEDSPQERFLNDQIDVKPLDDVFIKTFEPLEDEGEVQTMLRWPSGHSDVSARAMDFDRMHEYDYFYEAFLANFTDTLWQFTTLSQSYEYFLEGDLEHSLKLFKKFLDAIPNVIRKYYNNFVVWAKLKLEFLGPLIEDLSADKAFLKLIQDNAWMYQQLMRFVDWLDSRDGWTLKGLRGLHLYWESKDYRKFKGAFLRLTESGSQVFQTLKKTVQSLIRVVPVISRKVWTVTGLILQLAEDIEKYDVQVKRRIWMDSAPESKFFGKVLEWVRSHSIIIRHILTGQPWKKLRTEVYWKLRRDFTAITSNINEIGEEIRYEVIQNLPLVRSLIFLLIFFIFCSIFVLDF